MDHKSFLVQCMLAAGAGSSDMNKSTQAYPFSSGFGTPPKRVNNPGKTPNMPKNTTPLPP